MSTFLSLKLEFEISSLNKLFKFLTERLDMALNELSRMLCYRLGWNLFEIKVEIT